MAKSEPYPPSCPACKGTDLIVLDSGEQEDGSVPVSFLCGHCSHAFSGTANAITERYYPKKTKEKK